MIINFQFCAAIRYQKLKSLTVSQLNFSRKLFWEKKYIWTKIKKLAGRSDLVLYMYDYLKQIMSLKLVSLILSARKKMDS